MDGDDYSVHPVVIGRGAWTWSLIWIDPLQQPIGWSAAPTVTPARVDGVNTAAKPQSY